MTVSEGRQGGNLMWRLLFLWRWKNRSLGLTVGWGALAAQGGHAGEEVAVAIYGSSVELLRR